MSSRMQKIDVNTYINRLSDKEFTAILDSRSGERDHLILNVDKNSIEASKLRILISHPAYDLVCNNKLESIEETKVSTFQVIKRDSTLQPLDTEKIYERIYKLWRGNNNLQPLSYIKESDIREFCNKIVRGIYNKISTSELDEQAAVIAAHMATIHYEWGILASRIAVSNQSKNLNAYSFSGVVEKLYRHKDINNKPYPLVSKELHKFVNKNKSWIQDAIDYSRDYNYDFFGFKTLEKSYLLKIQRTTYERPQDMIMRVAIGIWLDSTSIIEIEATSPIAKCILNTYNGMSLGYFTHASPTLFNSGTPHNQFLSCFLFEVNDSLEGIMEPAVDSCITSKYAGGLGGHIHTIRSVNSAIKGTNGEAGGPIKFMHIFGKCMDAFDQGGRRKGALAFYMSPEHPQFIEFAELRTTTGDLANKSRILFIGAWIPDLLWYRWLANKPWSMFDPNETLTNEQDTKYGPSRYLARMYGDEYESRYTELEQAGRAKSTINPHEIFVKIAAAQISTGMPYMCYKDEVNRCSNQKNIGVIHSSNLCVTGDTHILYRDHDNLIHSSPIKNCVGSTIETWNGSDWVTASVVKTSDRAEFIKIKFTNGSELKCTPYHKFVTDRVVEAKELKVGQKLTSYALDKEVTREQTTLLSNFINMLSEKKEIFIEENEENEYSTIAFAIPSINKHLIPILYNELSKCGILPVNQNYQDNVDMYYISLNKYDTMTIKTYGIEMSYIVDSYTIYDEEPEAIEYDLQIESIEELKINEPSYCINEPINNMAVFNGILTMNCSEIVEYSDEEEYACCTLESICLPKYVVDTYDKAELEALDAGEKVRDLNHKHPKNPRFDFKALASYVQIATRNLNRIIDINKYPVYQTKLSNLRHRPLGNGAQGLADVFHKMKLAWGTDEALKLDAMIFETIYYAALVESCNIAYELYKSYAETARLHGKVSVPVDYQARPVVHKSSVIKYDGYNKPYTRTKFTTEWVVEPVYEEFVLSGQSNPKKLPILPKTAGAYSTFVGSPLSEGKFQFDLRNDEAVYLNDKNKKFIESLSQEDKTRISEYFSIPELQGILHRDQCKLSGMWDWESLALKIKTYGVRNSQLVALMPTASTSQIMGNNECIEPYTENIFKRTTLAGDFIVVNNHLIKELTDLGLWCESVENNIKVNNGSVQFLNESSFVTDKGIIPINNELLEKINDIKYRYRTAYEIPQKTLIDAAVARQPFIDQSQSLNLHMRSNMNVHSVIGMHFYGWAKGLKTGMYYLRTRPALNAQKFTISVEQMNAIKGNIALEKIDQECLSCGS